MSASKSSKLTVHEDKATALASSAYDSSVDAVGFNLTFIALRNPRLAVELIRLYAKAHEIKESDPKAPEEDFELFNEALSKFNRAP